VITHVEIRPFAPQWEGPRVVAIGPETIEHLRELVEMAVRVWIVEPREERQVNKGNKNGGAWAVTLRKGDMPIVLRGKPAPPVRKGGKK